MSAERMTDWSAIGGQRPPLQQPREWGGAGKCSGSWIL